MKPAFFSLILSIYRFTTVMTMSPKIRRVLGWTLVLLPFASFLFYQICRDPAKAFFILGIPAAAFASIFIGATLLLK